jgi:hypothetical protein
MSKQSEAKEKQGYVEKFVPTVCSNCAHYTFDRVQTQEGTTWRPEGWFADKNLRCGIGGFAVKKTGSCAEHIFATGSDT